MVHKGKHEMMEGEYNEPKNFGQKREFMKNPDRMVIVVDDPEIPVVGTTKRKDIPVKFKK